MATIRKKLIKIIGVRLAKAMDMVGINSKELYEYAYWRMRKFQEPVLENDHYEKMFTELSGVDRDFYDNKIVLDIGCGPRGSLEWATNAKRRIGLDPLVNSYRKLGINDHEMEYVHSGAEKMPFDDGYFDIVTSYNSLDHVDDFKKVALEICRILKPGGEFLIVVEIHAQPTIAEPVVLPWDFLDVFKTSMSIVEDRYLKFNPEKGGSNFALISQIPNHEKEGDGVVFARLKKLS